MNHQVPTQQAIVIQRNHFTLKIGMKKVRTYFNIIVVVYGADYLLTTFILYM